MSTSFISTSAIGAPARTAVMSLQLELAQVQRELATGRHADVGLTLGTATTQAVQLRQQQAWNEAVRGTNAIAAARLDGSQAALEDIKSAAQKVLDVAIGAGQSSTKSEAAAAAKAALSALAGQLNTDEGGQNLFGGENTSQRVLTDYFAVGGSAAKQAMTASFASAFGMTPDDATAASITPAEMSSYLDGAFKAQFADPSWRENWSVASSTNTNATVSAGERVETGVSANEAPFRQLVEAYVLMSDIGAGALNEQTQQVVLDRVATLVGTAIGGIGTMQSRLGASQERISSADERLAGTTARITARLATLEEVDAYATSTAATSLMTQLQASYALTARMQQLSILNYL